MNILVTGSTGYIGAHLCLELLDRGHHVVGLDIRANEQLNNFLSGTGYFRFVRADIRISSELEYVFSNNNFDLIYHLAGLKDVTQSIEQPLQYHTTNYLGSANVISAALNNKVRRMVFSGSASVYDEKSMAGCSETDKLCPASPYALFKRQTEELLSVVCASNRISSVTLRYFNPVGIDPRLSTLLGDSVLLGSDFFSAVRRFLLGRKAEVDIFGNDYPTPDGSAIRDFFHINDLVDAHLTWLNNALWEKTASQAEIFNVGSGRARSLFTVVKTFEALTDKTINLAIKPRREGDKAEIFANIGKFEQFAGWRCKKDLSAICGDGLIFCIDRNQEKNES